LTGPRGAGNVRSGRTVPEESASPKKRSQNRRQPTPAPQPAGRRSLLPSSRVGVVAVGALLGCLWGVLMWGATSLAGQESGGRGLLYLAITMAMIGAGIGAFFGAVGVRSRGERVSPRLRRRR
jgi:predicted lipid-binding transport protein (Tim44 family)